jgi:hypothetical protein
MDRSNALAWSILYGCKQVIGAHAVLETLHVFAQWGTTCSRFSSPWYRVEQAYALARSANSKQCKWMGTRGGEDPTFNGLNCGGSLYESNSLSALRTAEQIVPERCKNAGVASHFGVWDLLRPLR